MAGVDTVVLGVKNRVELAECVVAAEAEPFTGGCHGLYSGLLCGPLPVDLDAHSNSIARCSSQTHLMHGLS